MARIGSETARLTAEPRDDAEQGSNPWLVLAVLCSAVFLLVLDTTIVNNAQQRIRESLDASLTEFQWILDSYILTYAVLMLTCGRLGDIFGRKRLFIIGLVIFTLASLLCGAVTIISDFTGISGTAVLIFARIIQGIGGAALMPQSLSLLTVAFPPAKRGAALGIWGSVTSLGAVIGPVFGGFIVTNFAWEWVFLINVPVGIFATWAAFRLVPESLDPQASRRLDWAGVALSGASIFLIVLAFIEGPKLGWQSAEFLFLMITGFALLAIFVWWERRAADPMMKLELFAIRNFSVGNGIRILIMFSVLGALFPMTLFLQGALGMSPIEAGLTMAPQATMIVLLAPFAGRLSDRFGPRWLLVGGLALATIGLLLTIVAISPETTWVHLLPGLLVTGAGLGLTFAPMTAATMVAVPQRIAGSASGILTTTGNIGQLLGIAIMGSVLQSRLDLAANDALAGIPMEPSVRERLITIVRDSRIPQFTDVLTPQELALLPESLHNTLVESFATGMTETFLLGVAGCAIAAVAALAMRNPIRDPKPNPATRLAETGERADGAIAD